MVLELNNHKEWLNEVTEECNGYPFPDSGVDGINMSEGEKIKTCLDVGCNVGGFVNSRTNEIEQFYCVDASLNNTLEAKKNTKHLTNKITIVQKAVDKESGNKVILRPYVLEDGSVAESGSFGTTEFVYEYNNSGWRTDYEGEEVKTISIEDLTKDACREMGVNEIDLLKVDVEGSEYNFMFEKDLSPFKWITMEIHNFLRLMPAKDIHPGFEPPHQQEALEHYIMKTHDIVVGFVGQGNYPHYNILYQRKDLRLPGYEGRIYIDQG